MILDATCGGRMMWFQKKHSNTIYADKRQEHIEFNDGRIVNINPDIIHDFTQMPFKENSFDMVLFDPPHLHSLGHNSYMAKKYGRLLSSWQTDIRAGFDECYRVLKIHGTLIFKWNVYEIPLKKLFSIIKKQPLFGHHTGKMHRTVWLIFMKESKNK